MFTRKIKLTGRGAVDGGEGRGIPLGGQDARRPRGYNADDDTDWIEDLREFSDRDFGGAEEEEGPDRRRDPLRR